MKRIALILVAVLSTLGLSSCTPNIRLSEFAQAELGQTEANPQPYMYSALKHPNPALNNQLGFWCDEFVVAMLAKTDRTVSPYAGDPSDLAHAFPLAEPPYQAGDLVFVSFYGTQKYDHVGILTRAEGDHLWTVEGNYPTGAYKENGKSLNGVVLNERWVGDGAVSEIRRP